MTAASGAILGLLGGTGICVAVAAAPPMRRRGVLEARLAPYLSDTPRPSRFLAELPRRSFLTGAVHWLDAAVGGATSVRRRLDRLGAAMSVEDFRFEQVVWGALGGLAGFALGLLVATQRGVTAVVPALLLTLTGVLGGVLGRDWRLTRDVRMREQQVIAEFPTVAEMLALAVAAGEGPLGALDRVSRLSTGELARELRRALAEIRTGTPMSTAMDALAARMSIPALTRFVDGMVIAIDRGTPLSEVLREQATDVRESGKRALLESGGRKEIAMMVPVVFLILPVTVFFALFPGYYGLTLSTP